MTMKSIYERIHAEKLMTHIEVFIQVTIVFFFFDSSSMLFFLSLIALYKFHWRSRQPFLAIIYLYYLGQARIAMMVLY